MRCNTFNGDSKDKTKDIFFKLLYFFLVGHKLHKDVKMSHI